MGNPQTNQEDLVRPFAPRHPLVSETLDSMFGFSGYTRTMQWIEAGPLDQSVFEPGHVWLNWREDSAFSPMNSPVS